MKLQASLAGKGFPPAYTDSISPGELAMFNKITSEGSQDSNGGVDQETSVDP
jgi:hypothetical protein